MHALLHVPVGRAMTWDELVLWMLCSAVHFHFYRQPSSLHRRQPPRDYPPLARHPRRQHSPSLGKVTFVWPVTFTVTITVTIETFALTIVTFAVTIAARRRDQRP